MALSDNTLNLLRLRADKPGRDEVKAYFLVPLGGEFGANRSDLDFENRVP